jgi:hypothetical protein
MAKYIVNLADHVECLNKCIKVISIKDLYYSQLRAARTSIYKSWVKTLTLQPKNSVLNSMAKFGHTQTHKVLNHKSGQASIFGITG